jgi:hypothetical protein
MQNNTLRSPPSATRVRCRKKPLVPLRAARWSNDGKFVVGGYVGSGKGRVGDVYICPAGSEPCEKLTIGYNPIWSRDDSVIYSLRPGQFPQVAELWSFNRKDRREVHLADLGPMYPIGHIFDVSPQGEIAYTKFKPGENELWLADFSTN